MNIIIQFNIMSKHKIRGVYSQTIHPQNTKLDHNTYKKGPSQQYFLGSNQLLSIPSKKIISLKQSHRKYSKSKSKDKEEKIKILPKVFQPYEYVPGKIPRNVAVQRLKRKYESYNLNNLLQESKLNIQEKGSNCLQIINFIYEDFIQIQEYFNVKQQQNLIIEGKGLCFHKGKWRFKSLIAQKFQNSICFGNWKRSGLNFKLHKLYICFNFEDPLKYMQRLNQAFRERDRCLNLIKYHFYVDNMPIEDLAQLSNKMKRNIIHNANAYVYGIQQKMINEMINQANNDYRRTMNHMILQNLIEEGLQFPVKVQIINKKEQIKYHGTLQLESQKGVKEITILNLKQIYQRPVKFSEYFNQFCFHSLYVNQNIPNLLLEIRNSLLELQQIKIFDLSTNSPFYLQQFKIRQDQSITNFSYYIKGTWIPSLVQQINSNFAGFDKGWFNIKQTTKTTYQVGKLKRFIILIRLYLQHNFELLLKKQINLFVNFIKSYIPKKTIIQSSHKIINIYNTKPKGPLFQVQLMRSNDCRFAYNFKQSSFTTMIIFLLDKLFQEFSKIPDIQPFILPQFYPSGKLEIYFKSPKKPKQKPQKPDSKERPLKFIDQNIWVWQFYDQIRNILNECSKPLSKYLEILKQYEYLLNIKKYDDEIKLIQSEDKDAHYVYKCIKQRHKIISQIIQKIPEDNQVGIYLIKSKNIIQMMKQNLENSINELTIILAKRAREQSTKILNRLIMIKIKIMESPNNIQELVSSIQFILSSELEIEQLKQNMKYSIQIFDMIEQLKYRLTKEQLQKRWKLLRNAKQAKQICAKRLLQLDKLKIKFLQQMKLEQQEFRNNFKNLLQTILNFKLNLDINKREEYYKDLKMLQQSIKKVQEQAILFNKRQKIFNIIPLTNYQQVFQIQKQYIFYFKIWKGIYQWKQNYNKWINQPLISYQINQPQYFIEDLFLTFDSLIKEFKRRNQNQIVKILILIRQQMESFRPKLPLLVALNRKGIIQRHILQISAILGFKYAPSQDFTLTDALNMGLLNYVQQISEVSERAGKEYNIEKMLKNVKSECQKISFQLISYNYLKGQNDKTYIIQNSEVIALKLDEYILTIQSLQYNPYKKFFQHQINAFLVILRHTSDTLDQWMNFQRQWIYLNPIFDSPDIQKQLPQQTKKFRTIDHSWKYSMTHAKSILLVLDCCMQEGIYERMRQSNKNLEIIQRQLNMYLQKKRQRFSRFYFLSNYELLEILSKNREPQTVEPYLRKLFENIVTIKYGDNNTIVSIISVENEKIDLIMSVNLYKKQTEFWMKDLEQKMKLSIKSQIYKALNHYNQSSRCEWILKFPAQSILTSRQTIWTRDVQDNFTNLQQFYQNQKKQINNLVYLVKKNLSHLQRLTINSLIVLQVHNLDVIQLLKSSPNQFQWSKQLRYYLVDRDTYVDCLQTHFPYGYQYIGNTSRLVITPLTDRCYITLMGALRLGLGGAPSGPAGTGKTQTTKDLAKALAKQCVVFNCSQSMDYLIIGKFFKGLATSGAWACFDQFNRMDIQVLSVIAQQLSYLFKFKSVKEQNLIFQESTILLDLTFSVFITMNPGYAGRTQLPDNLKSLFRSIAMMIPDFALISQIILYSYGFTNCRELSKKIVTTFKISSQQLSKQDHYDYGMRAVRSVLSFIEKINFQEIKSEEQLIYIALREINIPKLVLSDIELFENILCDLFPKIKITQAHSDTFRSNIRQLCEQNHLQLTEEIYKKLFQLKSTIRIRHGIMLVGQSGSGKTQIYKLLSKQNSQQITNVNVIYPKAISIGQLYGEFNQLTRQWSDGIINFTLRNAIKNYDENVKHWIIMDGPVDPLWIESMNTVLDDTKKLCLNSGEILQLNKNITMIFQVQDLLYASPATVSRCGMIYMQSKIIGVKPIFEKYVKQFPILLKKYQIDKKVMECFGLLENSIAVQLKYPLMQLNMVNLVQSCMKLFSCFISIYKQSQFRKVTQKQTQTFKQEVQQIFIFSIIWSIGSIINLKGIDQFQLNIKQFLHFKLIGSVFQYYYDHQWKHWTKNLQQLNLDKLEYHEIIIPTNYYLRTKFLFNLLIQNNLNAINTGSPGIGKTRTIHKILNNLNKSYISAIFCFSACTTSKQTMSLIDSKLDKRSKKRFGPALGKKLLIFIDELDMPKAQQFGAQPPIELLRMLLNCKGWYKCNEGMFINIEDVSMLGATSLSQKNVLSQRFEKNFCIIGCEQLSDKQIKFIFLSIVTNHFNVFDNQIKQEIQTIVNTSIQYYNQIKKIFLRTPNKLHYLFTLRDFSKLFYGLCLSTTSNINTSNSLIRLYVHELKKTFEDKLINIADLHKSKEIMTKILQNNFRKQILLNSIEEKIIFCGFLEGRYQFNYREIQDKKNLLSLIQSYQDQYNLNNKQHIKLIFFLESCQHIIRIYNVLNMHKGNIILCGYGGSGRQSLAKLAVFIAVNSPGKLQHTKNYNLKEWRQDLKLLLLKVGLEKRKVTLILNDNQLNSSEQMQDLNSLLTSLDIPILYTQKDIQDIQQSYKNECAKEGIQMNKINLYNKYLDKLKSNFHIVLLFNPLHKQFKKRIRQYPSLINQCSFNYFHEWPAEALVVVSKAQLIDFVLDQAIQNIDPLIEAFKMIQKELERCYEQYWNKQRRRFYVTPVGFIQLVNLFKKIYQNRKKETEILLNRYNKGLHQLTVAEYSSEQIKQKLKYIQPKLIMTQTQTNKIIEQLQKENLEALQIQKVMENQSYQAAKASQQARNLQKYLQQSVQQVQNKLKLAWQKASLIKPAYIAQIKSLPNPSQVIRLVLAGVVILLHNGQIITERINDKVQQNYFETAKKFILSKQSNLLSKMLIGYQKQSTKSETIAKLEQKCLSNPRWNHKEAMNANKAIYFFYLWVDAIVSYHKILKNTQPLRLQLTKIKKQCQQKEKKSKQAFQNLKVMNKKINQINQLYLQKLALVKKLEKEIKQSQDKIERSIKISNGLKTEKVKWNIEVKDLLTIKDCLIGDSILIACLINYFGPFISSYRNQIKKNCSLFLKELMIQFRQIKLHQIMTTQNIRSTWSIAGLPINDYAFENSVIVHNSSKQILMIDPQNQGNNFIKNLYKSNTNYQNIEVIKSKDPNITKILQKSIQFGHCVLIISLQQQIQSILDEFINPVFIQTQKQLQVTLGQKTLVYNPLFRLYLSTDLSNPSYSPQICSRLTLVNFLISQQELEQQMLAIIVRLQSPNLQQKKMQILRRTTSDKKYMKSIEDQILDSLSKNEISQALGNDSLINKLENSKKVYAEISRRVKQSQNTQAQISLTRETYRNQAKSVSKIYFSIVQLQKINYMYQFSLEWFIKIFIKGRENFKQYFWHNISISLYEKHRLLAAILITQVSIHNNKQEWKCLFSQQLSQQLINTTTFISKVEWMEISYKLSKLIKLQCFKQTYYHLNQLKQFYQTHNKIILPQKYQGLSSFQIILLINCFKPQLTISQLKKWLAKEMGEFYVSPVSVSLKNIITQGDFRIPLLFILSNGSDPYSQFQSLSQELGMAKRFQTISLGKGQGKRAQTLIQQGLTKGSWILLQNCHLGLSWMPRLETIISSLESYYSKQFRLFLTSMPNEKLPSVIIKGSIKITLQQPKDVFTNLNKIYKTFNDKELSQSKKYMQFKKILYGLSLFHATIQERKRFGSIGWNILYQFTFEDLIVNKKQLKIMLDQDSSINFQLLRFLVADINYGGRVTDDKDYRLIKCIAQDYLNPQVFNQKYKYNGTSYINPNCLSQLDYLTHLKEYIPFNTDLKLFGLHQNVSLTTNRNQCLELIKQMNQIIIGKKNQNQSQKSKQIIRIIKLIQNSIVKIESYGHIRISYNESMNILLIQQCTKYQNLIKIIHKSIKNYQQADQGIVVMTQQLQNIGNALFQNNIPKLWNQNSYLTIKKLGSWLKDLNKRIQFINKWIKFGFPSVFWLAGIYFPQAFLTANLQNFARKYTLQIDKVDFQFKFLKETNQEIKYRPSNGCYVSGIILQGCRFDKNLNKISYPNFGELFSQLPILYLEPIEKNTILTVENQIEFYNCPLYKVLTRSGTLLTTGHSTNFVTFLKIQCDKNEKYWIKAGAASFLSSN